MTRFIPLKRLATVRYGLGQPPELADDGVAIIRATNISRGRIIADDLIRARLEDLPLGRVPLLALGDVLVVRSGAYTGDSALITQEWVGAVPGYDLRITPGEHLDSRFAAYTMLGRRAMDQIDVAKSRAAQPHLNAEDLGEVGVLNTPLSTQRAIADYLDRETTQIHALVSAKRRMLKLLGERAVAYVEDFASAAGWSTISLARVISRLEQGWSPQCDARLPDDGEWCVLKVGCVNRGDFRPDEVKTLPADVAPRTEFLIQNGDLLMSRANSRDLIGSAAVATGIRPRTLLCDKLYRIHLDEQQTSPQFVSLWLQTRAARSQLELEANGASDSMQNIGQDTVRRVVIPLPDLRQQGAFVTRCNQERARIVQLVDAIRLQIDLLEDRCRALITAGVTGQLDLADSI